MNLSLDSQSISRWLATVCASATLTACAQRPPSLDPLWASVAPVACRYQLPAGQVEGETVTCADITVFEDEPSASTVRLHIARFRARVPNSSTATLFLQGGPGAHVQSELNALTDERLSALTAGGDYILFDQRGAGTASPALSCDEAARATPGPARTSALQTCYAQYRSMGLRLGAYDSEHIARDVEAIRKALGFSQINLVSRSYGTRVALEVLRRYESSVRAVVLDAPVPPDVPVWADSARNFEASFRALAAQCSADALCNERYPSLESQLFTTITALDAQPLRVDLGLAVVSLDGALLLGALTLGLYRREAFAVLPLVIDSARRRDATTLGATLRAFVDAAAISGTGASLGMNQIVTCNDSIQYFDDAAVARAEMGVSPRVRTHFAQLYVAVVRDACRALGPAARPSVTSPVTSSAPTLILSGAIDPVVSPSYGAHIAQTLAHSTTLTFERVGHGAIETPCGLAVTASFLAAPRAAVDGACAQRIEPITFR